MSRSIFFLSGFPAPIAISVAEADFCGPPACESADEGAGSVSDEAATILEPKFNKKIKRTKNTMKISEKRSFGAIHVENDVIVDASEAENITTVKKK
ncbi:hypothetical protein WR25_05721 [Diploscapter pachys]|uniref:Uncharacterized protein n=1 Tax=Diploscapter pachys TaxID=2018661 RepID=A0A2A2LSS4_9BILA|nr:hypothetical protein WR25_05721 [Diploscapter pachys]